MGHGLTCLTTQLFGNTRVKQAFDCLPGSKLRNVTANVLFTINSVTLSPSDFAIGIILRKASSAVSILLVAIWTRARALSNDTLVYLSCAVRLSPMPPLWLILLLKGRFARTWWDPFFPLSDNLTMGLNCQTELRCQRFQWRHSHFNNLFTRSAK